MHKSQKRTQRIGAFKCKLGQSSAPAPCILDTPPLKAIPLAEKALAQREGTHAALCHSV